MDHRLNSPYSFKLVYDFCKKGFLVISIEAAVNILALLALGYDAGCAMCATLVQKSPQNVVHPPGWMVSFASFAMLPPTTATTK